MEMKKGLIQLDGESPMKFTDFPDAVVKLSEDEATIVKKVSDSIRQYLKAVESLVNGKYSQLRELLPSHLANPGNVLISCGHDGVVVRYESKSEKRYLAVAWRTELLEEVVYLLSQKLICCVAAGTTAEITDNDGIKITFSSCNPQTGISKELHWVRVLVTATLQPPASFPAPPHKPFCLASIRGEFSMVLHCEMIDENTGATQPFVTKTSFRMPAGWDCIEVYPFLNLAHWIPENATMWAEMDILAAVAAKRHENDLFQSLDPCAAARRKFATELQKFKALLDSNPDREEELQVFLKEHGALICPSYTKMWTKLSIGKRVTDFVFVDATAEYLLVEIERSTLPLFIKSGDPSSELSHACSQIVDWKRYIQDNLATVQRELGLKDISPNPRSLVIIGRSATLTPENRRKLLAMDNETPMRRIVTYDDIYSNAKSLLENMFGPLDITASNTQVFYLEKGENFPFANTSTPV